MRKIEEKMEERFMTHEDGSLAAYAIDYEFPKNFWDNWC